MMSAKLVTLGLLKIKLIWDKANLWLALRMVYKLYTSVAKGLKLTDRKFLGWGLKLGRELIFPFPILYMIKEFKDTQEKCQWVHSVLNTFADISFCMGYFCKFFKRVYHMKSVCIIFSGPYFPRFELNMKRYRISLFLFWTQLSGTWITISVKNGVCTWKSLIRISTQFTMEGVCNV